MAVLGARQAGEKVLVVAKVFSRLSRPYRRLCVVDN